MVPINTLPNIELTLNGLLVVFVDPQSQNCTVGVLRETPGNHAFDISVLKADANGKYEPFMKMTEADIKDRLEIIVSNTSKTGISRRKMDAEIDRTEGPVDGNGDSFRWVVDFEDELYHKPIGAKKAGFGPTLTLNNGELLARRLSENELKIKRGIHNPWHGFGKVATETGIDIVLDQPNSTAVFKNGDNVVFTADNQSRFQIRVNRGCTSPSGGSDADSYYSAVDEVSDDEKIFFSSTALEPPSDDVSPPISPDAACLNFYMSRSTPG